MSFFQKNLSFFLKKRCKYLKKKKKKKKTLGCKSRLSFF
jgi:hypothetical protein